MFKLKGGLQASREEYSQVIGMLAELFDAGPEIVERILAVVPDLQAKVRTGHGCGVEFDELPTRFVFSSLRSKAAETKAAPVPTDCDMPLSGTASAVASIVDVAAPGLERYVAIVAIVARGLPM